MAPLLKRDWKLALGTLISRGINFFSIFAAKLSRLDLICCVEIFAKFYKVRQHRLNPTFFRDMANGRPNQGEINEDFLDILTNLIRQEAFEKCHCKGPCEISKLVEFMLRDNDSEYSDDTESEESEEEEIISGEYEKACKENPKLRNRCYLSIYCSLKKEKRLKKEKH